MPRALVRTRGLSLADDARDLSPWHAVFQQTHGWIKAGCFQAVAHDLQAILRMALERNEEPSAVILDGRTLHSTPESGSRAGFADVARDADE